MAIQQRSIGPRWERVVTGDVALSGEVARRQYRHGSPEDPVPEQPSRQDRADRPRRLLGEPEGGSGREGRRNRRADRPGRSGRCGFILLRRRHPVRTDAGDPAVAVHRASRRSSPPARLSTFRFPQPLRFRSWAAWPARRRADRRSAAKHQARDRRTRGFCIGGSRNRLRARRPSAALRVHRRWSPVPRP